MRNPGRGEREIGRRRRTWTLTAALALAALGGTAGEARAQASGIPVGAKAPVVALEDVDGSPVRLDAWIGKQPVVLEFWATWCSSCEELEPTIKAAHARYGDRVAFVGVAVPINQSARRVKLYAEKHALPLVQLYDREGAATDAYRVPATSYVVVVDRAGTVVYTGLGGDQAIGAAIEKALK